MTKVLILTWGAYYSWNYTTYVCGDDLREKLKNVLKDVDAVCNDFNSYKENGFQSRTTLPYLYELIKPDKVVIVLLDSTIANLDYVKSMKVNNYEGLLSIIRDNVIKFIKENMFKEGRSFIDINELRNKVLVVVAPSVGTYVIKGAKENIKQLLNIEGRYLDDFLIILEYLLIKKIIKQILESARSECTFQLYLDLTHGVNFLPSFTLETVLRIADILATTLNDIYVITFNADPYVRLDTKEVFPLKIHVPLFLKVKSSFSLMAIKDGVDVLENKLKAKLGVRPDTLNAVLGSIVGGYPLSLIHFLAEALMNVSS